MAKLKYMGSSHERVLRPQDMAAIGVEDHPGLIWNEANQRIVEVEDDAVVKALLEAFPGEIVEMVELTEPDAVEDEGAGTPETRGKRGSKGSPTDPQAKAEAEAAQKP